MRMHCCLRQTPAMYMALILTSAKEDTHLWVRLPCRLPRDDALRCRLPQNALRRAQQPRFHPLIGRSSQAEIDGRLPSKLMANAHANQQMLVAKCTLGCCATTPMTNKWKELKLNFEGSQIHIDRSTRCPKVGSCRNKSSCLCVNLGKEEAASTISGESSLAFHDI